MMITALVRIFPDPNGKEYILMHKLLCNLLKLMSAPKKIFEINNINRSGLKKLFQTYFWGQT